MNRAAWINTGWVSHARSGNWTRLSCHRFVATTRVRTYVCCSSWRTTLGTSFAGCVMPKAVKKTVVAAGACR